MTNQHMVDILIVEDDPRDLELILRTLRKRNLGNQIHVAEDGVEALDYLFRRGAHADRPIHNPRVVFLDLKLPRLHGLEVLKAVRQDERTRTLPVVVLTSSAEDPDIKAAYALGVNSYVVKPVSFEAFGEAISSLGLYWLVVNQPPSVGVNH